MARQTPAEPADNSSPEETPDPELRASIEALADQLVTIRAFLFEIVDLVPVDSPEHRQQLVDRLNQL
jgi:hypothetical protein